jgi:inorganic pyrophosphatase
MIGIDQLAPATSVPDDFNVIIEIAANSDPIKYEVDKDSGLLCVDRFMPTAMHYPCNYGYVPNTLADDGDPADVLVVTPHPVQPGSLIRCRALGVLMMEDESGMDAKIIALPIEKLCIEYAHIKTLEQLPETLLKRTQHFFEHYKDLEPTKWVKVRGWEGVDAAKQELESSIAHCSEKA